MSTPILPFELPLPWEHDSDGSDIYINEPIQQVMMPRGWGWLSKMYGEQRADRIQRDAVKFATHAVNHHQELVTRLQNLRNAIDAASSKDQTQLHAEVLQALQQADETLKKLQP